MELRQLRYFVGVAEAGSLSRAAEKLFIAQPPLSTQIRQFEQELGVALFTRHPKGVRLTAAGQALLPEARGLLDRAARMTDVVRNAGDGIAGSFSLGFVPSAGNTVLPELVRRLRQRHPHLNLELQEMISSEQAEALVAGRIDAGLARAPARHPRLLVAQQMSDPFCLALPAGDPGPAMGLVDLRQFSGADFVAFTRHRGPAYFDQSIRLCNQAGFSPRIRFEASAVHGVLAMVSAGLGVALVPASCALLRVEGTDIRALKRKGSGEVLALLRRRVDANPVLALVEDAVKRVFAAMPGRLAKLGG